MNCFIGLIKNMVSGLKPVHLKSQHFIQKKSNKKKIVIWLNQQSPGFTDKA